jgi:hypothetical protein
MRIFLLLMSITVITLGCDKNLADSIPDNIELDISQDGNADFVVSYLLRTEGDPAGNYQTIIMNLQSTENAQVLKSENAPPVFLEDIDLIETEVDPPLYWEVTNPASNISFPIARIRTDYDEITHGMMRGPYIV